MSWISDTWSKWFPSKQPKTAPAPQPVPIPAPSDTSWKLSASGTAVLMKFEGLRLTAYQDVAGIWTIGYGSTRIDGQPVKPGQTITQSKAILALQQDASRFGGAIQSLVKVPLNQNQIDALIIFTYNVGVSGFSKSTLLRTINARQPVTEDMFTRWNKITKDGQLVVSPGLTTRRQSEYQLFMKG